MVSPGDAEEEMNRFLRSAKVVSIDRQLVQPESCWSFCVTYLDRNTVSGCDHKEKVDYRSVLDESSFAVFSQLRAIRKHLAEVDAVPAYAVFTDAELAEMAKLSAINPENLRKINGIATKRMEKYGDAICQQYQQLHATDGQPD